MKHLITYAWRRPGQTGNNWNIDYAVVTDPLDWLKESIKQPETCRLINLVQTTDEAADWIKDNLI